MIWRLKEGSGDALATTFGRPLLFILCMIISLPEPGTPMLSAVFHWNMMEVYVSTGKDRGGNSSGRSCSGGRAFVRFGRLMLRNCFFDLSLARA